MATPHISPSKKLGKLPADPARPVLDMGAHLTRVAFEAPAQIDYAAGVKHWILGGNNNFGTCGPTSVANLALLVSTALADAPVTFTDDEIFDLYRRSGNPDFDPATGAGDNGVDMTVLLSELVKNGIGSGARNVKALAFGSINPHSEAQTWAAGAVFGGVLWGATLRVAQETQFDDGGPWDYKSRSRTWGGHAILSAARYVDQTGTINDRTGLVTWATLIDSTDAFIERQVDEAYVVIFPWHLKSEGFLKGLDLAGVAAEFKALTGRDFPDVVPTPAPKPVPTPPTPTPSPPVSPTDEDPFPVAALNLALTSLGFVVEWVNRQPR